jgi:hypothetical protein
VLRTLGASKRSNPEVSVPTLASERPLSKVRLGFCSNTESTRDDPYQTSRENSLELIELSSINKVSLV